MTTSAFQFNSLMWVPILGWVFIVVGIIWPFEHPFLLAIWWIDLFLSVVVHAAQIPMATRLGRASDYSAMQSAIYTFIFGATWWRPLAQAATPKPVGAEDGAEKPQ